MSTVLAISAAIICIALPIIIFRSLFRLAAVILGAFIQWIARTAKDA